MLKEFWRYLTSQAGLLLGILVCFGILKPIIEKEKISAAGFWQGLLAVFFSVIIFFIYWRLKKSF